MDSANRSRVLIALLLLLGVVIALRPALWQDAQSRMVRRAIGAWMDREYPKAERLAAKVLAQWPDCALALVLAGESASKNGYPERALDYFLRVTSDSPVEYVRAQCEAGVRLIHMGRAIAPKIISPQGLP